MIIAAENPKMCKVSWQEGEKRKTELCRPENLDELMFQAGKKVDSNVIRQDAFLPPSERVSIFVLFQIFNPHQGEQVLLLIL